MNKWKNVLNKILPVIDNLPKCWRIVWMDREYLIKKFRFKDLKYKHFLKVLDFFIFLIILMLCELHPQENAEDLLRLIFIGIFLGIKEGIAISIDRLENDGIN